MPIEGLGGSAATPIDKNTSNQPQKPLFKKTVFLGHSFVVHHDTTDNDTHKIIVTYKSRWQRLSSTLFGKGVTDKLTIHADVLKGFAEANDISGLSKRIEQFYRTSRTHAKEKKVDVPTAFRAIVSEANATSVAEQKMQFAKEFIGEVKDKLSKCQNRASIGPEFKNEIVSMLVSHQMRETGLGKSYPNSGTPTMLEVAEFYCHDELNEDRSLVSGAVGGVISPELIYSHLKTKLEEELQVDSNPNGVVAQVLKQIGRDFFKDVDEAAKVEYIQKHAAGQIDGLKTGRVTSDQVQLAIQYDLEHGDPAKAVSALLTNPNMEDAKTRAKVLSALAKAVAASSLSATAKQEIEVKIFEEGVLAPAFSVLNKTLGRDNQLLQSQLGELKTASQKSTVTPEQLVSVRKAITSIETKVNEVVSTLDNTAKGSAQSTEFKKLINAKFAPLRETIQAAKTQIDEIETQMNKTATFIQKLGLPKTK